MMAIKGLAPKSLVNLSQGVKSYAQELGFDAVGITDASSFPNARAAIYERIAQGLLEGMPWFTAPERVESACDPKKLLAGARSVISLAVSYYTREPASPAEDNALGGRVARYAWGDDYHNVIKDKLRLFGKRLLNLGASREGVRVFVDTGPMVDRAAAQRSGVGWYGKNTNIIVPGIGSWVFLAQVVTDLELDGNEPLRKSCGTCSLCIASCPTGAIVAPYVVDSTRCISYLTIECRGAISRHLRPLMGGWVFGCDICQEVCPVNHRTLETDEGAFQSRGYEQARPDLLELLELNEEDCQRRFKNSAIKRAKRVGLQRNACIALGNLGDPRAVPALSRALAHLEPLVRGHAAWALGQIGGEQSRCALVQAQKVETDASVLEEIGYALSGE